jgi:hypothetical protein
VADLIHDALAQARKNLDELVAERTRIDREIMNWKRVVHSLAAVSGEHGDETPADVRLFSDPKLTPLLNLKFTDAIRNALASVDGYISAPAIRDQLNDLGFDFSKYKQELVPIHNALKRLEEQGEAQAVKNEQGQTLGYRWISPIARALAEEGMHGPGAPMMAAFTANRPNRETATAALEAIEKDRKK